MNIKWILILFMIINVFGEELTSVKNLQDDNNLEKLILNSVHRTRSLPEIITNNTSDDWNTISELLDVYSTRNLANNWKEDEYPISNYCEKDITRYIKGLKENQIWALKADDASGRYTNGFFWGNSFFTGSATECAYIGYDYSKKNDHKHVPNAEVGEFNSELKVNINSGPSGSQTYLLPVHDTPPYKLGFFMMRIAINGSTISPVTRSIQLGVCLPFSCTADDVAIIGKLAASNVARKHSFIEKVRDHHQYYDIYEDPVFWTLVGSSLFAMFMMIIGTSYDYWLSAKSSTKKIHIIYDVEKPGKLEQIGTFAQHKLPNVYLTPVNNNNENEINIPQCPVVQSATNIEQVINLNVCEEILLSFSIRENMKTICDSSVGRDTISTIHGLRALSMAWVILGHTCIVMFKYSDNMEYRKVVEKKLMFQTITNGAFSVDTFFFMGGLLVSYLFFRTNAMGDLNKLTQGTRGFVAGFLKFMGLLIYRFCRLTTPYMFVLGVVNVTMKWFHYNSVFEPPTSDHINCPNYWWRNLLYINTLFPVEQMCMLWSWYLADDTQFYIIGAVILVVATNHFKIAAFTVVTLLISSWITTGYIALINNHMPSSDDPLALFDKIYDKPWTRLGPYFIGMSVGYFLFKTDCKVIMSKATVCIGWLFSISCLLSLLYGLYEAELSPITAASYSSLSHSAWALALAWIVIACSTGYGGWVNKILSAPILYPFSRVTYCAYLVHPLIIRLTAMNMDSPFHLGKDIVMIVFIGQVVLSYVISFIVSLAFEAPVVSMLKIVSPKKKKRIH
ncbi:hypothetical protein HCN44_008687 [Aphidius gifuensis]|uniref:Nose resistant-to-fluoxetine protein N-terminal domain-containing protein n=2 Tax=Aphidius gifuensis TaxID=684658 RepID=A0A834XMJ5_APHGI|nr:hypothetical protein HCN44_008687 [Aphidius gifuensis]